MRTKTVALFLHASRAGSEAVRAAELVDATVAGLTAAQRAELFEQEVGFAVERWRHREDHVAQIEAVLR